MSSLADVFKIFSCPGCHGIQCLKLYDINEKKRKVLHCLFNRLIYRRKNKGGQKLYDVNIRAIYECRQVGIGHENLTKLCCYLNMPEPMLSNNYQNISPKLKEAAKRAT